MNQDTIEKKATDYGYPDLAQYEEAAGNRLAGIDGINGAIYQYGKSEWTETEGIEKGVPYLVRLKATDTEFASKAYVFWGAETGDVNGDGYVDARDATLVLAYYADRSADLEGNLTESQLERADFSFDRKVNGVDATMILSYYADNSAKE